MAQQPEHPTAQLSAYLDGALAPQDLTAVESHLRACDSCSDLLVELRAVSGMLAALPERAPRRSLLPRRALPSWLVPARWASTVAAAAFALAFVVSSVEPLTFRAAPAPAAAPSAQEVAAQTRAAPALTEGAAPAKLATAAPAAAPAPAPAGDAARVTPQPRGAISTDRAPDAAESRPALPAWGWLIATALAAGVTVALERTIRRRRA